MLFHLLDSGQGCEGITCIFETLETVSIGLEKRHGQSFDPPGLPTPLTITDLLLLVFARRTIAHLQAKT